VIDKPILSFENSIIILAFFLIGFWCRIVKYQICIKRNLNELIPWQIEKDHNDNHGLADERWYYHSIATENFLGNKYGLHLQCLQYEFGQNRSLQHKQNGITLGRVTLKSWIHINYSKLDCDREFNINNLKYYKETNC